MKSTIGPAFKKGDRVAWHHTYATQHSPASIVLASAIPTLPGDDPGIGQFGTVVGPGNDEGTYWEVLLDSEKTSRVLTGDEIVRIEEDES